MSQSLSGAVPDQEVRNVEQVKVSIWANFEHLALESIITELLPEKNNILDSQFHIGSL